MKRAVQIVSIITLTMVFAAIVAQALMVAQGIYYDPNGQPVNPTVLTQVVIILGVVGILAMPLTAATFVLGVVATGLDRRYGWLAAIVVAGGLTLVGLFAMIWILLSVQSPVAFQTPLALIPLVTLAYTLLPAQRRMTASTAV